jgi:hypothetical protein
MRLQNSGLSSQNCNPSQNCGVMTPFSGGNLNSMALETRHLRGL